MEINEKHIVRIDNKKYIPSKVVLIATDNKVKGLYLGKSGTLYYSVNPSQMISEYYIPQHIYFISEAKIESGDWFIYNNVVYQCKYNYDNKETIIAVQRNYSLPLYYCKKIVATTDLNLRIPKDNSMPNSIWKSDGALLPQPSEQYLETYVDVYNFINNPNIKGSNIIDTMLEVVLANKKDYVDEQDAYGYDNFGHNLKLDINGCIITTQAVVTNTPKQDNHE